MPISTSRLVALITFKTAQLIVGTCVLALVVLCTGISSAPKAWADDNLNSNVKPNLSDSSSEGMASEGMTTETLGVGALGRIEPRSRIRQLAVEAGIDTGVIDKLLVTEGQKVEAGQLLATFADYDRRVMAAKMAQSRWYAMKARVATQTSNLALGKSELARQEALKGRTAFKELDFDRARNQFQKAQAESNAYVSEMQQAESEWQLMQQQLSQAQLKAPIDGTILKIHAWPGERNNDKVMELADLTQWDVVAEVYEDDVKRLKVGQKARVLVPSSGDTWTAQVRDVGYMVYKNDLNNTDPLANKDNRIVEVRLSLPDSAAESFKHQIYRQVQVQIEP